MVNFSAMAAISCISRVDETVPRKVTLPPAVMTLMYLASNDRLESLTMFWRILRVSSRSWPLLGRVQAQHLHIVAEIEGLGRHDAQLVANAEKSAGCNDHGNDAAARQVDHEVFDAAKLLVMGVSTAEPIALLAFWSPEPLSAAVGVELPAATATPISSINAAPVMPMGIESFMIFKRMGGVSCAPGKRHLARKFSSNPYARV